MTILPILLVCWKLFFFGVAASTTYTADVALAKCEHALADSNYHQLFPTIPEHQYDSIFKANLDYLAFGFDFPVGKPDGVGYYLSQQFGQNNHLGEDWNGKNGGNTDLGDPVFGVAHGLVIFAQHVCCGWGNTVRIVHFAATDQEHRYVESVYAHLDQLNVQAGDLILRGQQIGTIGTADGKYTAHLHLELRNFVGMSLGPGYSKDHFGYLVPSDYIQAHRPQ